MTRVERVLIWAGLMSAPGAVEARPLVALDCGHESWCYARSSRTSRTACFSCYHLAITPRGSRAF